MDLICLAKVLTFVVSGCSSLLRVCFVTLAVARLLPAFSRFLHAFPRLCVWLRLISGLVPLLFSWLQVDWPDELSSFLVLEAQD